MRRRSKFCTSIGDFRNVFKFHAYSVNKRLFLTTTKLVWGSSDHGPNTNGLLTGACLWSHHDRRHLIMCILMSIFMSYDNVDYVITNRHWQKDHLLHFEFISLKCNFRKRNLIESQLMRSSEPEIMKMCVI